MELAGYGDDGAGEQTTSFKESTHDLSTRSEILFVQFRHHE